MDIISAIDQATGCHQCGNPLGSSPSSDFCSEFCQATWQEKRVDRTRTTGTVGPVAISYDYMAENIRSVGQRFDEVAIGTNFTLHKPLGVVSGEFMVAFILVGGSARPEVPAGWTMSSSGWAMPPGRYVWTFVKRCEANDPAHWTGVLSEPVGQRTAVVALPSEAVVAAASTPEPAPPLWYAVGAAEGL